MPRLSQAMKDVISCDKPRLGEIRSVVAPDRRIAEAKKLGFRGAIAPATIKDKFVLPVKDLRSALVKYMNNK